jgi:hypothetical protein
LPTLEEAMSLMEPVINRGLYIDAQFDAVQRWIWTSDFENVEIAWVVVFYNGYCVRGQKDSSYSVRVVRGG